MSGDDPTEALDGGEDPTEPIPTGGEDPTEALPGGASEAPTQKVPAGGEAATESLKAGNDAPTEQKESWAPHQPEVKTGTGILVASILTSIALIGTYIFAGGLDFKPTPVADPCDSRAWTDPSGLEDTAQQLALSALDGAACDLGVSREELTRALATPESQAAFLEKNGISDAEFQDALRSGVTRAVDDAENAGAIDPVVASGIRTAVSILPIEQLIPLIQDASSLLDGDGGSLNDLLGGGGGGLEDLLGGGGSGLGELLDGLGNLFGGGTGSGGSNGGQGSGGTGGLGDLIPPDLEQSLRDQLPPDIENNLPEGSVDDLGKQVEQGLQNLLSP